MKPTRLMLDSGAFSVWSRGAEFPLDDYIRFCLDHPEFDYYVSLDVIHGKKGERVKVTPEMMENACRQGWENYLTMIRHLPQEKVIPVFHKGERFDWFEKYIDAGCPYVGIGQFNSGDWEDRSIWLRQLKNCVMGSDGKPVVKTHGFAVTSIRNMLAFPWTSVDSASWIKASGHGLVQVPRVGLDGRFRYDRPPFTVSFSPRYERRKVVGRMHYTHLPVRIRNQIDRYFRELNVEIGCDEIVHVEPGYELKKTKEIWIHGGRHSKSLNGELVAKHVEVGLCNSYQRRFFANGIFYQRVGRALPLENLYLAGGEAAVLLGIEKKLKTRLFSYYSILRKPGSITYEVLNYHLGRS